MPAVMMRSCSSAVWAASAIFHSNRNAMYTVTRIRKMIRPWTAFWEIWAPHVGPTSWMLMSAVPTPAWSASWVSRRARSSPPSAFVFTSAGVAPACEASAPTSWSRSTLDRLRNSTADASIPACLASAAMASFLVAGAGVGLAVGAGVEDGVAPADGETEGDALAFALGEAEGVAPAEADALGVGAGVGEVNGWVCTTIMPPAAVTAVAGWPRFARVVWTCDAVRFAVAGL